MPGLGFAAAGAALPCVPVAQQLELLIEASFFDEDIEFGAGEALAERGGAVGNPTTICFTPCSRTSSRSRRMSSLRLMRSMVLRGCGGIERGNAFEQEVEIV